MKKKVSLICLLCFSITLCVLFTSCDEEQDPVHTHTYQVEWSNDDIYHWYACENNECSEVSQKEEHVFTNGVCKCGYEKAPSHTHTFEAEWSYDDTHHWYSCEDNGCSEVSQKEEHVFTNGVCKCGYEKAPSHTHTYEEEWSNDDIYHWYACEDNECSEVSQKEEHVFTNGVCKCGYEKAPPHTHTFEAEWSYDDIHHWYACEDDECSELSQKGEHNFSAGFCEICFSKQPDSEGLVYELNSDGASYSVNGIGTCKDKNVLIPAVHNGLPVTRISDYAFTNNSNLVMVTIPDSVLSVGWKAFSSCSNLNYNEYGDACYLGSVSNPYHCLVKVKDVNILSCDINNDTKIICNHAFSGCNKLEKITLPGDLVYIGRYAFNACTSLKTVTFGKNVDFIGESAFYDCNNLIGVYITNIEAWCNIIFENENANPLTFAKKLYHDEQLVTELMVSSDVTSIGDYAFYNCADLKKIDLSEGIASIGQSAFYNCTALLEITLPNSLSSIGHSAFRYTKYYNTDGNWTNNVLYIGKYLIVADYDILNEYQIKDGTFCIADFAFNHCEKLTAVHIPNSVKHIGSGAFYWCTKLSEIAIPTGVTSIEPETFEACTSLKSVLIPNNIVSIGKEAFCGCDGMIKITLPPNIQQIDEAAFFGCERLEGVYIEDLSSWCGIIFADYAANPLTYSEKLYLNDQLIVNLVIPSEVASISDWAFYRCTSLKSITLSEKLSAIGSYAFCGCSGVTNIMIPKSVAYIGAYAFYACENLELLSFEDMTGWPVRFDTPSTNAKNFTGDDGRDYWYNKCWCKNDA